MKVYTIDIYYGDKLIDTIEIEASNDRDALLDAYEDSRYSIKAVVRRVNEKSSNDTHRGRI